MTACARPIRWTITENIRILLTWIKRALGTLRLAGEQAAAYTEMETCDEWTTTI